MPTNMQDTFNVMILAALITLFVIAVSFFVLSVLTGDLYLDSYFILEVLFNAQNTAASEALAQFAFGSGAPEFLPIILIVVLDNLSRILIVSFIIAAVIDFFNFANIESVINDIKASTLKNHVILCGYNGISERLIKQLGEQKTSYVVIEPRRERELELNEKKILSIDGSFADEEMLKAARIDRATAIVFTSENNADNVVGSIIARRLNSKVKILSRLGDESIRKKVYGIGTDMAVIPEHLAGIEIGEYISRNRGV